MSRFALRHPYFVIVVCLLTVVLGVTTLVRMPVDLFPKINLPVVVVATFYSGMPPEDIESNITGRYERFFTLAPGIDHMESRSLPGVSLIKVYFQPGQNPDTAAGTIANLAMANMRRLPPGTLPPVVLKFDASSLPVCLVTLQGEGLNETQLRDLGAYSVRNQLAGVPGASVPQPFGGKYRQIMVYVDPLKLEAHQMSVMDVVRGINDANLILPAGDVRIGPVNYSVYANAQVGTIEELRHIPLKTVGNSSVVVGDVAEAKDAFSLQSNIVRVNGQRSAYVPVLKQGGDANTIAVVDGIRRGIASLTDVPKELAAKVIFDQSDFVRDAISNLLHEGAIGLGLTALMVLVFLGSLRGTVAVLLSIPLSALATFMVLALGDSTINTMVLGGLALAFSRLIDNSVVVLENIFRHLEHGETPQVAADKGGREMAMPVLAATLTTVVVFFPVTLLYGVSKFLFVALALAVVFSMFASYVIALTVVPLFCSKFIKAPKHKPTHHEGEDADGDDTGFNLWFNRQFHRFLGGYERLLDVSLLRPLATITFILGIFLLSLALYPKLKVAYFPRTDPGQFVINLKAPSGTRLEITEKLIAQVEELIRKEVPVEELGLIVSNIGVDVGFSAIYTPNSAQHTAFVQASLSPKRQHSSFDYMARVRKRLREELPQLTAYFQTGGLVDAVLNLGLPAPIDIQVTGSKLETTFALANDLARQIRALPGVGDVLVPQDIDYPALKLEVDRARAAELGLTQKEVIQNIITALSSGVMIAPSFFVDPKSGNDYILTVQYPENLITDLAGVRAIPIRAPGQKRSVRLDAVCKISHTHGPTEVNHYQIKRVIDVFVSPEGEDLGRVAKDVRAIIDATPLPDGVRINVRGMVQGMESSFRSFGLGLFLSVLLVYLILVAQFQSFLDPFLILLAVPTGLTGVLVTLWATGTSLNVMSLMGVLMMVGIVVSNSILIVEFTRQLREQGQSVRLAVAHACRVRLRPVLMTSFATLFGLAPMALKLGTGAEAYAPLALAIIGGLAVSLVLTVFIVPAAYLLLHGNEATKEHPSRGSAPLP